MQFIILRLTPTWRIITHLTAKPKATLIPFKGVEFQCASQESQPSMHLQCVCNAPLLEDFIIKVEQQFHAEPESPYLTAVTHKLG